MFNNLELTLGMALTFYTSVAKGLELKERKFCGLVPTFVGTTPILNRVKQSCRFEAINFVRNETLT